MSKRSGVWFLAALLGAVGCSGKTSTGSAGSSDQPGSGDPSSTGQVSVTVVEASGSPTGTATPLAGVTVTATTTTGGSVAAASGIVSTGTTDSTGAATLTLFEGVYNVALSLKGYTAPAPTLVGIIAGGTVTVSATLSEGSSLKPTLVLVAGGQDIGYGNQTTVTATATSPVGATLTYAWANTTTGGIGTVAGSGASGTITAPTLAAAMAAKPDPTAVAPNLGGFVSGYTIPNTFGVLPIISDANGSVTASVTATDPYGQSTTASVSVTAASVQTGTQSVAVGTRVYLNSGLGSAGKPSWTLTAPTGSKAAFDSAQSNYPNFIPDVTGAYVATNGTNSITIYAGSWVGAIDSTKTTTTTTPWGGVEPVPFGASESCVVCHASGGYAIDEFTPWIGTKHAVHMTYGMDGVSGFSSGESCLTCHSVGFDAGNANTTAGGFSQVAAAQTPPWTYPATISSGNWAKVPPAVAQLANIQCESCHGPNGDGAGGLSAGHDQQKAQTPAAYLPFQSPRISYASEDCAVCHASGTGHHEYSEWTTLNPDSGRGHGNLAIAQSEGLKGTGLNTSCGRCHAAQGFTEYVQNLQAGNVGTLSTAQQAIGQLSVNNIQPQTCQACHDPHQDALDPVTGADTFQLRVYDSTGLTPAGFAASGMGTGAICVDCHNSRNGGYQLATNTGTATNTAYLHEDSDPIGSNPANPALNAYASLGTAFSSVGAPHEANQADVFQGHNAYFLGSASPVVSPHSAVANTCVGCHMTNNPQTYSSHGAAATQTHIFWISNAETPALCAKCHAEGTSNVDGAGLQASTTAGLNNIVAKVGAAVMARLNDSTGAYVAPAGYGAWVDTGTFIIPTGALTDAAPAAGCTGSTDATCGLSSSAAITIAVGSNPVVSVVASPQGRSGINAIVTLQNPISISFTKGTSTVTNTLSTFTVNLAKVTDASSHLLFASNGNMFKANWNWALISQDGSLGVHNPPFVSAVLAATADPQPNPNAAPPAPGGLWF